jgi:STE24 endopeptidase
LKTKSALACLLTMVAVVCAPCASAVAESPSTATAISPADDAWRAQLPRDPEAATQAYLARLSPEAKARSDAYFEGGYWLQLWGLLYGLAAAWLLLATRISHRMRDFAERRFSRKPLQTALYAVQYLVVAWLLVLPLTIYQGFFREHQYGLATQSFGPWFSEQLVGLGVSIVLGSIGLTLIYGVIRRARRTWWLWGALVGIVPLMFVLLIAPVYIDPLFNTYKPLEEGSIKSAILSMARANGVPATEVYQFDASRQTNRISANVSGFLGTTAIRLNDNLLKRTSPPEIKAVMAHELGHYVLNHIYKLIVMLGVVVVAGFAFVQWAFDRVNARRGRDWGVRGAGDSAGLPLLVALLSVYLFAMTPVTNSIIRVHEVEADIFGLDAAREPDGFAEVALKLSEYRKMAPGPIEEFVFYDHPSGRSRIYAAMRWKAEMQ